MPIRARTPCRAAGCGELLTVPGFCAVHEKQRRAESDARRGTAHERGYGRAWQKARAAYLSKHPLCSEHEKLSQVVAAEVVDHVVPHRGDRKLFWDSSNWQALCKSCHDIKTAREDGGFGHPGGGQKSGGCR